MTATAFIRDEEGSGTIWALFWSVIFLLMAGLAIDVSNAHRNRMLLQVTADASALAALVAYSEPVKYAAYTSGTGTALTAEGRAQDVAVSLSGENMPEERNGVVLAPADVRFGRFENGTFTEGAGDAIEVITRRTQDNANPVPTILLSLLDILPSWDLYGRAVAERYRPDCETDGIITLGVIDLQSNNLFSNGICLHGGSGIEVNQNNVFADGVRVSLPSRRLLTVPGDDPSRNIGLEDALSYGDLMPQLAMQADDILTGLSDLSSDWQPDYITSNEMAQVIYVNENAFDPGTMIPGNVYQVSCTGGSSVLNLLGSGGAVPDAGKGKGNTDEASGAVQPTIIENVVVVTDCEIRFDQNTILRDAIIGTTATTDRSVSGSSGVSIGEPDLCTEGGGAQIVTAGGMRFAAQMEFHGSQLVSKGPVSIAAQVNGLSGTSIQSLSRIDLASNNSAGLCEGKADPVLQSYYYRLVD